MKVFIGGSRAVSKLNPGLRAKLDEVIIDHGHMVLIGDANGADRAVQQYLAERHYQNAIIFCMAKARNNVANWPTRVIESTGEQRGFAYYAAKDSAMAQEAKCGLMLWDGKSKGTLNNILNLLKAQKKALVYFWPTNDFYVVAHEGDFQALLARCRKEDIAQAARGLGRKDLVTQEHLPLLPAQAQLL